MHALALDVVQVSGPGLVGGGSLAREQARELLARTTALAAECVQDPRADLGIGSVHLPEPGVLGIRPGTNPHHVLARRCRESIATRYPGRTESELGAVSDRLEDELGVIETLGYATYFLTVAQVCDLIREMGVRVAARGSGAGSLVNYLLGISGVDPMRHGLLMERFCSPLRAELPDIDIDVESARRTEIYERILDHFGGERVTCVSMMDTYRVRHAIRDAGAALGLPPPEVDAMAKAFPHIAARNVRNALAELPELRASGLDVPRLQLMFDIVERLDGLPRHIALHPCGVVLSDSVLLDRTPVEASWLGFPMSQFDKDDVEEMGLLKLDVLGIRMQSAMAHAIDEVERVDGASIDLDDESQVPFDDEPTFELVRSTKTLGCFQIESPGQRELIGKFGPRTFDDLIIDISLFRPGPVKSDMIIPFLNARQGWKDPSYLHPTLVPALEETEGVVVFHEQVLMIVAETTGVTLAQADEVRRALGTPDGQERIEAVVAPRGPGPRLRPRGRRQDLGGPQGLRVVRLLQGARRRLRAADLPVGLAQDAPPGRLPRRGADPRPRHVPQAAHPRRRPHLRHRRPRPRRQRLDRHLPLRAHRRRRRGHPALARRRPRHQRGRGRPDRRRPAVLQPLRLLAARPRVAARCREARARRRFRLPARHRPRQPTAPRRERSGGGGALPQRPRPTGAGHPARPAAPRRRARPLVGLAAVVARTGSRPRAARTRPARHGAGSRRSRPPATSGRSQPPSRRPPPGRPSTSPPS